MERYMLKRRIIPIELFSNGRLVKTKCFDSPRDVGDPIKSSKVYSDQDADEIVLLNIDRNSQDIECLAAVISQISKQCFVPLTVGGGILEASHAARLFESGADKVLINSASYQNPDLITQITNRYGRQAVVVGIDVRKVGDDYSLFSRCGSFKQLQRLEEHIASVIAAGAGEIMVQRIELDGTMTGYDQELLKRTVTASGVPVIGAAGAGNFIHLKEAFEAGVDAAACGSLFNFGDNNPLRAKAFLKNYGIPLKRV